MRLVGILTSLAGTALVLAIVAVPVSGPFGTSWTGWSENDGWGPFGGNPGCWESRDNLLLFDCNAGAPCGSPAQQSGWVDPGASPAGVGLSIAYRGTQLRSEDPSPRWPGAVLRYLGPGDFVAATPMVNLGQFGVFVVVWTGGVEAGSKWVPSLRAGPGGPEGEASFVFAGVGNRYHLLVDEQRLVDFEAGPPSGGVSGPGVLVGCGAWRNLLAWEDFVAVHVPVG